MSAGSASFTNVPSTACAAACRRTSPPGPTGLSIGRPSALGDLAVDLAERGREVHDAGAVVDGHELVGDDPPRRELGSSSGEEVERPLVVEADEVGDRDRADDLGVVAEHVGDAAPRRARGRAPPSCRPRHPRTYSTSGPTAAPTFETSVHGVVVHTRRSKSRSTTGKRT